MDPNWKKFFDPQTLAELSGSGLRRLRPFDGGALTGVHRSSRHGHSVEFAEHRPYVLGDDLRSVDWKVYARTDRFFLQNREDETALVCHLMLDASGSMAFAGLQPSEDAQSKFDYAARVAASLGFITLTAQDQCSLTFLGGNGIDLPLSNGEPQMQGMVDVLARCQVEGDDHVGQQVQQALARLTRPGIVVLVSDLLDSPQAIETAVRYVRAAGHDLFVIQVLHPEEKELTVHGMTRFQGMEGEPPVDLQPEAFAEAYHEAMQEFCQSIEQVCEQTETPFLALTTDQPIGSTLAARLNQYYG